MREFWRKIKGWFVMDEPYYEDYADEGWEDYYDGWEYEECPYDGYSFAATMWKKGYLQAKNHSIRNMYRS